MFTLVVVCCLLLVWWVWCRCCFVLYGIGLLLLMFGCLLLFICLFCVFGVLIDLRALIACLVFVAIRFGLVFWVVLC